MKKPIFFFAAFFSVLFSVLITSCSNSAGGGGGDAPSAGPSTAPIVEYNVTYVITNGSDDMTGELRTSGKYTVKTAMTYPEKQDWQFKGWYSDQAQTQAVASFATLSGDVVLYGHWAEISYKVQFEGIDGAKLAKNQLPLEGFSNEDTSVQLPTYTKRHYVLEGWYLDSGCNGSAVTQIDSSSSTAGETLILYAKWAEKVYTVISCKKTYDDMDSGRGLRAPLSVSNPELDQLSRRFGRNCVGVYLKYENGIFSNKIETVSIDDIEEDKDTIIVYPKLVKSTTYTPQGATMIATSSADIVSDIASFSLNEEIYLYITDQISSEKLREVNLALKSNKMTKFYFDAFSHEGSYVKTEDATNDSSCCFRGCKNLTGIIICGAVAKNSFKDCTNLLELVYFDVTNTYIEDCAFENCSKLRSGLIDNWKRVKKIGKGAFKNCVSLESVDLSNAAEIDEKAFENCKGLKSVTLPVEGKISKDLFTGCDNLNETYFNKIFSKISVEFSGSSLNPSPLGKFIYVRSDSNDWERVYSLSYETCDGKNNKSLALRKKDDEIALNALSDRYGWDFDAWYGSESYMGEPITSISSGTERNVIVFAKWLPQDDVRWHILYYKENLDGEYVYSSQEYRYGKAGTLTDAGKDFEHYTVVEPIEQKIIAGGTEYITEVYVYYNLEKIKFVFDLDGGSLDGDTGAIEKVGKYGETVNISNPQKAGATFAGWNTSGGTLPSAYETNATYKAIWISANTIEVVPISTSDISVTKTQSSQTITFAAEQCDSYSWKLDGVSSGTSQSCIINTLTLLKGSYTLTLEAKKGGRWYSYTAQIKVN